MTCVLRMCYSLRLDLQTERSRRSKERRGKTRKEEERTRDTMLWLHNKICFGEERRKLISWLLFLTFSASFFLFFPSFCPSSSILAVEKEGTNFLLQFFILFKTRCSQYFCKRWKYKRSFFWFSDQKRPEHLLLRRQRHQSQILLLVRSCNSVAFCESWIRVITSVVHEA